MAERAFQQDSSRAKDCWDKLAVIASVTSGLVLPLVLVYLGHLFNGSLKNREISSEYVKLAIQVLQDIDTTTETKQIREWAATLLVRNSPVPVPPELEKSLRGLQIAGPKFYTTSGFPTPEYGSLKIKSEPYSLYVYVDNELKAMTPADIELPPGDRFIEWRDTNGNLVCQTKINLAKGAWVGLKCTASGEVKIVPDIRKLGRAASYF